MPKEIRQTLLVCASREIGGQTQVRTSLRARKLRDEIARLLAQEAKPNQVEGLWLPSLHDGYDQFVSRHSLEHVVAIAEGAETVPDEKDIDEQVKRISAQQALARLSGADGRPLQIVP